MNFFHCGGMFDHAAVRFRGNTSRAGTELLLDRGFIEVTAHFQRQLSWLHLHQGSVTLPVLQSTSTQEFIQLATSRLPLSLQSKKFILFHNERVVSSGTLAENGIGNRADVYLVENKPFLIQFAYHSGNGRTRLFSVEASAAVTIRSLKAHLAGTLSTECPLIDTTNHVFEISDKHRVLADDFHPVQPNSPRTQNCKKYTVHLLSKDEKYTRMKLIFPGNQRNSLTKTVLFVPENSTFGQLRKEVARATSFPLESIVIATSSYDPVYDDHDFSMIHFEEWSLFDLPKLPLDAAVRDCLTSLDDGCFLLAKEEQPFSLQVRADVHGIGEVSLLRLKVHSYDTTDTMVQATAEKMAVDSRLVKFSRKISLAKAIHEQGWKDGNTIKVDVFPRGATITLFHKDEAFRYEAFVRDTATTKVRHVQLSIEKRHSFHPDSVLLHHQGQVLDPDASLSSAGVGMDSAIMVSTKKPGEAGADPSQAPAVSGTPRPQAARVPSTKYLTTFRKRLMKNRVFPKQVSPKRLKLTSETSPPCEDSDNETSTGSKALVVRAARSVVAPDVTQIQLQDTTDREEAPPERESSNPTGACRFISPTDGVEQSPSEAEDGPGMCLDRMSSGIISGFNRLEGAFQEIRRNLPGMFPMCRASTGPLLAVEHIPQPTMQGVSEEALRMVAEELGSDWDAFASRGLRLCYNDIESMRRRHPNSPYLQALGAVHKWKQSRGSQATKAELQKRLEDNGLLSIAESIENL